MLLKSFPEENVADKDLETYPGCICLGPGYPGKPCCCGGIDIPIDMGIVGFFAGSCRKDEMSEESGKSPFG